MRTLALLAALLLAAPAAVGQASLFTPIDGARTVAPSPHHARFVAEAAVLDAELVAADVSALTAETVSLDLLGETVVFTRTDLRPRTDDDWTWTGRRGMDTAVLVARAGRVTGAVWADGSTFEIRPAGDRLHTVARIDPSAFRAHGPDYAAFVESEHARHEAEARGGRVQGASPALQRRGATVEVDILVPYTSDLPAAVLDPAAYVQLAVDATNAVYANSGIDMELRLVHTYETPTLSTGDHSTDLSGLQHPSDGLFDEAHTLRDAYGADLVAMINFNSGPSSCGQGYLDAGADFAFSVTSYNCTTSNFTFAHELGHNVGANHDPYQNGVTGTTPTYAYGQGYVDVAGQWRTVMSYNSECSGQTPATNCAPIPYFSSPAVTYDDTTAPEHDGPTGDAAARDVARVHRERGATVSAFRTRPAPAVFSISPASVSISAAPGETGARRITISNSAAAGASPLSWRAAEQNLTANGTAITPCSQGQVMERDDIVFFDALTDGVQERGQSFQVPCLGRIRAIAPRFQVTSGQSGATFSATLRLFDGEGTQGAERATVDLNESNLQPPPYHAAFPLAAPLDVAEGDIYTWFLDITSGRLDVLYSNQNPYGAGTGYVGTSAATATAAPTDDLAFRVVFDAPSLWYGLTADAGSIDPGGSFDLDVSFDATGLGAGTHSVDLAVSSNDPGAPTVTVPVTLTINPVSAEDNADGETWLGAPFPNPTSGVATVEYRTATSGPVHLSVVDLLGREVAVLVDGPSAAGARRVALPSTLAPGVYVVRLVARDTLRTRQAVIVR